MLHLYFSFSNARNNVTRKRGIILSTLHIKTARGKGKNQGANALWWYGGFKVNTYANCLKKNVVSHS